MAEGHGHANQLGAPVLLLAASAPAFAQEVTGRVVGVHDGDTITVLTAEKLQVQVRLADIDAPELGQPFGQAAKRELSSLCFNQLAKVQTRTVDVYGRTVGVVSCEGRDASRLMVQHGMAWAYRQYLKPPRPGPAGGCREGLARWPMGRGSDTALGVPQAGQVGSSGKRGVRTREVSPGGPHGASGRQVRRQCSGAQGILVEAQVARYDCHLNEKAPTACTIGARVAVGHRLLAAVPELQHQCSRRQQNTSEVQHA